MGYCSMLVHFLLCALIGDRKWVCPSVWATYYCTWAPFLSSGGGVSTGEHTVCLPHGFAHLSMFSYLVADMDWT